MKLRSAETACVRIQHAVVPQHTHRQVEVHQSPVGWPCPSGVDAQHVVALAPCAMQLSVPNVVVTVVLEDGLVFDSKSGLGMGKRIFSLLAGIILTAGVQQETDEPERHLRHVAQVDAGDKAAVIVCCFFPVMVVPRPWTST